ncbi:MAG: M20/M25/M40 family metallo-hydrolase [Holophagales bacterium]|nr:M20/M25/M40 family metallo-hydrolase [Holophagales bacterium]MYD20919.1 M20/M25/M40 family metallo-hydrolase [Holophagales bacterium]MYI34494.1 M20/M25/M40 family metallo-hydrolase [Holophagales bacterium]
MKRLETILAAATLWFGAVASAAGAQAANPRNLPPAEYMDLASSLLEQLIEIDTTDTDRGDNTRAARVVADALLGAGFPAEDVHVLVPDGFPTKGNLVARLRGSDPDAEPILLLAHLDVVEAQPEDWSPDIPPFEFQERDGYFYGRGTADDKDECAIHTANLIRLRRERFVPERDIVIALTADEESGTRNGVEFLLADHRDLIDAAFALNEGGGGMERDGRKVSNNVQAAEKVYLSFWFAAKNPGGHSSLPVRENAIYELSAALLAVREFDFPVMLNEVTEEFFDRSADLVGGETGEAMRRIVDDPDDAAALAVLSRQASYNARLRTTCVATLVEGGHAENALPQLARANVNCRLLPDHDPDEVEETLRRLAAPFGVEVERRREATPSPPSPLTGEVLDAIERVTEEMWPGVPVLPVMSSGATDGLYLRNAGIPVYGVSGIFGDMDDVRVHGRDERIRIDHFHEGQEFLYRLVKALAGAR